jgi:hypothetical protein
MKPYKQLALLISTLALAGAANAALLTGTTGNSVTDYSAASLVSFDLDLANFSTTRLDFVIEEADLLAPSMGFNAIVRNLSGAGLSRFTFSLQGITFAAPGSVTPTFGTPGATGYGGSAAALTFVVPEFAEFHFGNPFAASGFNNWLLSVSGLRAGDAFSITATVPEPSTLALMLASLAMFSFAAKNRDKY